MYCINYKIKQEDSLYRISRHYNVSLQAIMDANPLVNVYSLTAGENIHIPVGVPQNDYKYFAEYMIRDGDSLGELLDENNINFADLQEFNDLYNIYLMPGTSLRVPIIDEGERNTTL